MQRHEAELTAANGDVNRELGADFERYFAAPAVLRRHRSLDVPVLLVHGRADPRPLAAVQALASELRHGQLVVLDGVSHFPYWEAPDALQQALRPFLATGERPLAQWTRWARLTRGARRSW